MVNTCCGSLDRFVTNVYVNPDSKQCPDCGEEISQEQLAKIIYEILREKPTNLRFSKEIQYRAAFWSLSNQYHGLDKELITCFNIVHLAESATGVLATVRTDSGEVRKLAVSEAESNKMVEDPSVGHRSNWAQIRAVLTEPSVGKAGDRLR